MWLFWPIVLSIAALAGGIVLLLGRTRRALWVALAVALAALGVIWLAGWQLVESGWHDVDGFIDCYPSCDGWHLAGSLLIFGPPIVAVILVATVTVVALRRRRRQAREM
jgi:hypothetical protein